eukprot:ctg_165.g65
MPHRCDARRDTRSRLPHDLIVTAAPPRLHLLLPIPSTAGILRCATDRRTAPGQLSRRDTAVGHPPGPIRELVLRGGPARHHRPARRTATGRGHHEHRGDVPSVRYRSAALQDIRAVARARARRDGLAAQLPHPDELAGEDDPVQG